MKDLSPPDLVYPFAPVHEILSYLSDLGIVTDWADDYGEPGYTADGPVVLGYYWCQDRSCDYPHRRPDGTAELHTWEDHYSSFVTILTAAECEFEWDDEWVVSYDGPSLAYRTQPDSYSWESRIMFIDGGDLLTPADDISFWTDEVQNNPHRALPSWWADTDLTGAGWSREIPPTVYESGWHPGQTDDPVAITDQLRETVGNADQTAIMFQIASIGQFDCRFTVWMRPADTGSNED